MRPCVQVSMTEADTDTNFERTASRSADDDRRSNYDGITGRVVSVLWNRTENRPRALWRILGVYVAALVGIFVLPALALAGTELPPSVNGAATNLTGALVGLLLAVGVAKYVDRRPLTDYGLALDPSWLKDAGAGSVIALVLIFGVAPLYAALFSLLPIDIALVIGIFLVAVMPTTLSSGVVMSAASGGNPAHALFITVAANCLSVITIAVTLPLLLGLTDLSATVAFDQIAVMIKIGFYVLLPLSLGLLSKVAAGALIRRIHPVISVINQCLVLCIVWMGLSQAKPVLYGDAAAMGRIVGVVVCFHLLMLATAFLAVYLFRVPRGRMESIVFMGSQKTLPLSVILQVTLFPEYGAALIVCVMHHLASLFIDGFLMGRLGSSASGGISQN